MKRLLLTILAASLAFTAAYAAYNQRQLSDGGMDWVQSRRGDAPIKYTHSGDVDNFTQRVIHFDDFLGDVIADQYDVSSGTDAQAADPAVNADIGGELRLTSGNAGTGILIDGSSLTHELNWEPDNGNLVFEMKAQLSAITNVIVNLGFSDSKSTTALELPFELNTTTVTYTATNGVAWVFDTGATNDNWHCIANGNDSQPSAINSGVAPTATMDQTFRIEVNASGTAECFIDGTSYGVIENALSTTIDVTPIAVVNADSTGSRNLDLDFLFVGMDR